MPERPTLIVSDSEHRKSFRAMTHKSEAKSSATIVGGDAHIAPQGVSQQCLTAKRSAYVPTIICIETSDPFPVIRTMEEHSANLLAMSCGQGPDITFRMFYSLEDSSGV